MLKIKITLSYLFIIMSVKLIFAQLYQANGIKISTIEHLMATFYGLGVGTIVEIILKGSNFRWISKKLDRTN